jgi:hypothetical protein
VAQNAVTVDINEFCAQQIIKCVAQKSSGTSKHTFLAWFSSLLTELKIADPTGLEVVYTVAVSKRQKHHLHVKAKKERYLAVSVQAVEGVALLHYYSITKARDFDLRGTWAFKDLVLSRTLHCNPVK